MVSWHLLLPSGGDLTMLILVHRSQSVLLALPSYSQTPLMLFISWPALCSIIGSPPNSFVHHGQHCAPWLEDLILVLGITASSVQHDQEPYYWLWVSWSALYRIIGSLPTGLGHYGQHCVAWLGVFLLALGIVVSTVRHDWELPYQPWASWSELCGIIGSLPTGLGHYGQHFTAWLGALLPALGIIASTVRHDWKPYN